MSEPVKHKRNLSENYMRGAGWQSSLHRSAEFETFKRLQHAEHVRTKPKLAAANSTGGFGVTRKNKKGSRNEH